MSGKDGKQTDKSKKSDISKDWAGIDSDGSIESVDEAEPFTVIAKTSVYEDFDGTAETDGEVDSPEPGSEEKKKRKAKRREEERARAEADKGSGGKPGPGDGGPSGSHSTKKDGKKPSGGDGATDLNKK